MEFRILGPLYADADTGRGPAVIRQPLLQSALALLLLRANRPCPRGMLIEALWGSEPPASPEAALRVCISRLRRSLGECASRLESIGPPGGRAPGHRQQRGYMITVRPGELDLEEFTDLAAQGQAELDSGDAAAAATSLMHALALWGDPPLPDLPETDVIAADIARLTNLRQAAIDALIEARLATGETEQVIGQLRATVAANPGAERAYEQLMRAYHALGLRREALDVYRSARRALREQQGTEPGQALAILQRRILAEEMATDSAAHLSAISLATPMVLGWQAPAPPSDFTGRKTELAAIVDGLAGPSVPVTVVCGRPGAGKSSTAAAAALLLREQFSDGQLYAELGGVEHPRDPQDVLAEMLRAMGMPPRSIPTPGPARAAMYRSLLAGRKVLVVADDAATAGQVRLLVPAAGGAAVLVTSRGQLPGLAGARSVHLGGLPEDDALALLEITAGSARIAAEPVAARAIVAACEGLPLALRLAAVALTARPGLPLSRMAAELAGPRRFDILTAEDTSVAGAIGASYRALPGPARAALAVAAAAIPDDIPDWALAEISEGNRLVAAQLTAVGLAEPVQMTAASVYYRVHSLTRAFIRDRESAVPDAAAVSRLRTGWLRRSERAAAGMPAVPFVAAAPPAAQVSGLDPDDGLSLEWLDREQANLVAAAEQASSAGAREHAVALAQRLTARLCIRGDYGQAIRLWRVLATDAAQAGEDVATARAKYHLAVVLAGSHDAADEVSELLADCRPILESTGDLGTAALACCLQGRQASAHQRYAAAIRLARHAMSLVTCTPRAGLVQCAALSVLGITLARLGACATAIPHCQQARSAARSMNEPVYEAHATMTLAQVLIISGDSDRAADVCLDGLSLAHAYGSAVDAARFGLALGRARQCGADYEAAVRALAPAVDVFQTAGLVLDELTARGMLAACGWSAGDKATAAAQSGLVGQLLARHGHRDTQQHMAAADYVCELAGSVPLPGRPH
ncbi:MAG TPA: AfsR/SARP family transcriptional regulator, partial [Streptosporangiaceae bacterium]